LELVGARKISRRSLFRPGRGARVSISIVVVHVVAATKNAAGLIAKAASYFELLFSVAGGFPFAACGRYLCRPSPTNPFHIRRQSLSAITSLQKVFPSFEVLDLLSVS
jgi:hypothetical protein